MAVAVTVARGVRDGGRCNVVTATVVGRGGILAADVVVFLKHVMSIGHSRRVPALAFSQCLNVKPLGVG